MYLIECVPNFSEGRDQTVVSEIRASIASVTGIRVLGCESDADHNRSVITFVGSPDAVQQAALRGALTAASTIDMTKHGGVHPRIGAADVIPFVPLTGASMEDCITIARQTARELWEQGGVPSFLYEFAAIRPEHTKLEDVRRGGFEALVSKVPDIGGPAPHPTAGASAIGARRILIACNVNLATRDLDLARRIARKVRASSGGFSHVKALGLDLASRKLTQVSLNLTHHEVTPLHVVFEAIRSEAERSGVAIEETELIGFIPRAAAEQAPEFIRLCRDFAPSRILEEAILRTT
jgi:glutamate formiminotransferase